MSQLYEMRITASGEIRDADGNLIESQPIEIVRQVTAEEAADILGTDTEGEPS